MLKKIEFTDAMHKACFRKCKKKKITFISSAFDVDSLNYLNKFKLSLFKVPSGEITNIPYLEVLGKIKKKIILSTGMSSIDEIKKAIKTLTTNGTNKYTHCLGYWKSFGQSQVGQKNNYQKSKRTMLMLRNENPVKEFCTTPTTELICV